MIIYDPILTGSLNVNGTPLSSIESIDTVSGSVVDLTLASGSFSTRVSSNEASINSLNSASSSYLLNTTGTLDGDLTVTGKITAQEFHTEFVSASIIYKSGSTQFGNSYDDTHVFTGSLENIYSENGVTGSFRARGGSITVEGLDSDINLRLTSGSGASLAEIRYWVDSTQIGEINMDKRNGKMNIQTQTAAGAISLRPANTDLLYLTGSSVGIGTTSPDAKLTILDTSTFFKIYEDSTNEMMLTVDTGERMLFGIGGVEAMRISSAGNIGMGASTPQDAVHVKTSTNGEGLTLQVNSVTEGDYSQLSFLPSTAETTSPPIYIRGVRGSDVSTSYLTFNTNSTERIRISSSGNVGIGATSPNQKLEIRDTAPFLRITTTLNDDSHELGREYGGIEWYTEETYGDAPAVAAYVKAIHTRSGTGHTNGDMGLVFATGTAANNATATERMRIESATGNVGIGTTSPSHKLEVDGGSAETRLRISTTGTDADEAGIILANSSKSAFNDGIQIAHGAGITTFKDLAGEAQMVIDVSNSRVGIGTTGPTSKLDVAGVATVQRLTAADGGVNIVNIGKNDTGGGYSVVRMLGASNRTSWEIGQNAQVLNALSFTPSTALGGSTFSSPSMVIANNGNVGIGTTSPTSKVHIEGGNSGSIPLINLIASGTGTFQRGVRLLNSGMNAGDHIMYAVGRSDNARNMGQFYFQYNGDGSTTNRISMGLHSVDDVLNILGTGNVGIGTTSPINKLNIVGDDATTGLQVTGGTNGRSVLVGASSIVLRSTTVAGWAMELQASNNDGSAKLSSIAGAYGSAGSLTYNYYGGNDYNNAGMYILPTKEVLVGGTTYRGAYNLQCNGTGVWGQGAYVNGSDIRYKEQIKPIETGLDVVEKLKPVSYKYKEEFSRDTTTQSGFIAQDLQEALEGKEYLDGIVKSDSEYLSVAYQSLIPILTKAIQELKAENDSLKARIEALEG